MQYHTITDGVHCAEEISGISWDIKSDAAVAGLGTAGSIALIKAAELGVDVIGIERLSAMGGLGTVGCVWDYFYGSSGGRFEKINDECFELTERAFTQCEIADKKENYRCFNGAARSVVLDRNAEKSHCRIFYNTAVCGVYTDNGRIAGIRCIGEKGSFTIGLTICIDCTGDIVLYRLMGLPYKSGRDYDGRQMRFSKTIVGIKDGLTRGGWTMKGNRENKNALEQSQLILKCNTMPPCLEERYTDEYRIVYEGTLPGFRESPRIISKHELKFEDVLLGKQCSESLFYAFAPVDNVNRDAVFNTHIQQIWRFVCKMYGVGISVGVPLGTMLPRDCEGLLVAGKGMGVDSDLTACVRMRKDLEKSGETAAVAAYVAINKKCNLSELKYDELAPMLKENGCLDEENDIGLAKISGGMKREKLPEILTAEQINENLLTDYYGQSIVAAMKSGSEEIRTAILECLKSDNRLLRERAAFAGGVLKMSQAFPILLEMAEREPDYVPKKPAFMSVITGAVFLLRNYNCDESRKVLQKIADKYSFAKTYSEYDSSPEEEMAYMLKNLAEIGLKEME